MPSPTISIIAPTPPRNASRFRLLYRGALSLPDSHLLLDGLTFVSQTPAAEDLASGSGSGQNQTLLESPLALALESMRGVTSLRWMGPVQLRDVYLDESGGITMDIHPAATLSRIYFENTFCLEPSSLAWGIKVALGDTDGPETTYMLIYPRTQPQETELTLAVARITPTPPSTTKYRLPRPDDPTPRRPPHLFSRTTSAAARPHKRTSSIAADLGSGVRLGSPPASGSFRVPELPSERSTKGKERAIEDEDDVFGTASSSVVPIENKGKRKRPAEAIETPGPQQIDVENQMEKANKTIIKQSTIHLMQLPKTHPDYKDLYGAVYRGVIFALRTEMKRTAVDLKTVERLVKLHLNMYSPTDAKPAKRTSS
ncbi:VPS9 domain-containing protein [Mycena indigotica]|uniref:VPS9 domain-containing protein n=1 Tax=Mycena indigotica TaxID=2126181 RepID=A0A8H6S5N2_9AGAR|nr:VPS9 domain-containing protein [Mycena indigotica]KAF7292867.1 VPS9 domain-containing protein [Mycena indigotica]